MAEKEGNGGGGPGEAFAFVAIAAAIIFAALFLLYEPVLPGAQIEAPAILKNPVWGELWDIIKSGWRNIATPTLIFFDFLLLSLIIYAIIRVYPMIEPIRLFDRIGKADKKKAPRPKAAEAAWRKVIERKASKNPDDLRLAVIEADAVVDDLLRRAGYEGENMADRLSQIVPGEVPNIERVWVAHRLRNHLVHTPNAALNPRDAEAAIEVFREFLHELEAL